MTKAAGDKPLTKTQADYAINRIATLTDQRIAKLRAATPFPTATAYNFKQKLEMIRKGQAKLKPNEHLASYTDLVDAYEYPDSEYTEQLKAKKAYERKIEPQIATIRKESQAVIDKLMMAGAQEALDALSAYADKVESE